MMVIRSVEAGEKEGEDVEGTEEAGAETGEEERSNHLRMIRLIQL